MGRSRTTAKLDPVTKAEERFEARMKKYEEYQYQPLDLDKFKQENLLEDMPGMDAYTQAADYASERFQQSQANIMQGVQGAAGASGAAIGSTTMTLDFNKCANGIIIPNACTLMGFRGMGRNNSGNRQYEAGIFVASGAGTGDGIDYGNNSDVHEFVLQHAADADVTGGVSSVSNYRGPGKLISATDNLLSLAAGDAILPAIKCEASPGDKIYVSLTIMLLIDTVA